MLSRSKERGAVAVEMAVIVPVLALMAFALKTGLRLFQLPKRFHMIPLRPQWAL